MFPVSSSAGGPGPAAVPVGSAGEGAVGVRQGSGCGGRCQAWKGPHKPGLLAPPPVLSGKGFTCLRTTGGTEDTGRQDDARWVEPELVEGGVDGRGETPAWPPGSQAWRSLQLCPAEAARAWGSLCEAVPSSQGARGTPPRSPGATGGGLGSSQGGAEWAGGSPQRGQLRPHSRSLSFSAARPAPGPQPPPRCVHRNLRAPLSL